MNAFCETHDQRLRESMAMSAATSFMASFFMPGEGGLWTILSLILSAATFVLAAISYFGRQTLFLDGDEMFLERRVFGVRWRTETYSFDEIDRIVVEGSGKKRRISLTMPEHLVIRVATVKTMSEATRIAGALSRAIDMEPVVRTAEARAADAACLPDPPEGLRSEVTRRGERLKIKIDPRGASQRFIINAFIFLIIGLVLLFLLTFILMRNETPHDTQWFFLISLFFWPALILAAAYSSRSPTIAASADRLVLTRRDLLFRFQSRSLPDAYFQIDAIERRFGIRNQRQWAIRLGGDGGTIHSPKSILLGRLYEDEARWLTEALRHAVEGGLKNAPPLQIVDPDVETWLEDDQPDEESSEEHPEPTAEEIAELDRVQRDFWWKKNARETAFLSLILLGFAGIAYWMEWFLVSFGCAFAFLSIAWKNGRLGLRKLRRPSSGPEVLQTIAPNLPAAFIEELYAELTDASDFVPDVPVLPQDSLASYGFVPATNGLPFLVETAARHGLQPPTRDELKSVRTVGDLLELLET